MKRLAYAAAALLLLAAALALLAPMMLDAPAVRAEIQRRLSAALKGQVSWQALDIALLPSPHGALRGVRIEIPEKLGAAADELDVYLRLWPLLRGSVEISSVSVRKPVVRVTTGGAGTHVEVMKAYRAVIGPVAQALQEFAPDMVLRLEGATLDLAPLQIQNLTASATTDRKGVAIDATAASNLWKRVSLEGRVEYADLAARATVAADALAVDRDVPPVSLRAKLQTDGTRAIECEFEGSAAPLLRSAKGKATLPALEGALELVDVDLARALELVRRKGVNLSFIETPRGSVSAGVQFRSGALDIEVLKSDAALKLAWLPWMISAQAGRVAVTPDSVQVAGVKGAVGDSAVHDAAARIELGKTPRLSAASGHAVVPLAQWLPWLKTKAPLEAVESASGSAEIALRRLALRFDRPAEVDFDATVTPRDVRATLTMLPDAVAASGGALRLTREKVAWEKVPVAMLDAKGVASGSFTLKSSAVEVAVAEGVAGEKLVRWALERGALPERFAPNTPLRFAASRIAWAPNDALRADAGVEFAGGPQVGLAFVWRPGLLEMPRAAIKGAGSDALLSATVAQDLIHLRYSGLLQGRSIAAMLRQPPPSSSGSVQGELRLVIDRAQPERTSAEGKLRVQGLDLTWLAGKPALIEHADLAATGDSTRVNSARFGWDGQFFELRGEGRRTERGPVVDAAIESAGVDLFRLFPPPDPNAPKKKHSLWPLPVSGRVELRAGFVQYKNYRVEPFGGAVTLERERVLAEVQEARICGLSVPLRLQATPDDAELSTQIRMKGEPLERTVRCLTGGDVEITGSADLAADLATRGRRPHLLRDMTGTLQAEVRDGRVRRFALIGNILSFRNIASPHKMQEEGFPYRSMSAKGHFTGGAFMVEESFFDSDAVRLAASGRVDLLAPHSQLDVLVGLLTTVDRIAEAVPIIGDIFGGSMTAIPVGVHGDIRDPLIVPLGPRAVTGHLLGIFERTLKLPTKLVPAPPPKP